VYDIETLASFFSYSAINIDTYEKVSFVIHESRNDYKSLIEHLSKCQGGVGFNNINFDYPILHYMIENYDDFRNLDAKSIIDLIYYKAQQIIDAQNKQDFNTIVAIPEKEVHIKQLDLFKLWHYNNKARRTSLKALEISMNFPNVMEMPIDHTRLDISKDEIESILDYNMNDVLATLEFYKRSLDKITLRNNLKAIYNLPMTNWNDVKIGENIFLKLLSEDMNIPTWDLRKMRTYRSEIRFKDIILNYIEFENEKLKQLLNQFKQTVITQTKNGFKNTLILQNQIFEYGQGGIHQSAKSGIYESDDLDMILDIDVSSFYPNIAVNNNFRPEHLGDSFNKIYNGIYIERSNIPKTDPRNGAYKLMLNGCFGKAGDENSFLFDNKFLLSITVNGQLLISLLIDKLLKIPDIFFVQSNTDGITIKFNRKYYEEVLEICKNWEELTKLKLEYVEYSKMIIRDVNNYIAVSKANKVKYKGVFEIEKEYHKDNSFKIIPIALSDYFVKGIPIEVTVKNHKNIYDFCGRQKFGKDSYGTIHFPGLDKNNNPVEIVEKQQKNVRYYITNKGCTFIKNYNKGTNELINKGYQVIIFNKYIELDNYNINYNFYIKECKKILEIIEDKQLKLF
jgi:hypothetical protein